MYGDILDFLNHQLFCEIIEKVICFNGPIEPKLIIEFRLMKTVLYFYGISELMFLKKAVHNQNLFTLPSHHGSLGFLAQCQQIHSFIDY